MSPQIFKAIGTGADTLGLGSEGVCSCYSHTQECNMLLINKVWNCSSRYLGCGLADTSRLVQLDSSVTGSSVDSRNTLISVALLLVRMKFNVHCRATASHYCRSATVLKGICEIPKVLRVDPNNEADTHVRLV
jgi:hypothetical protein